MSERAPFTVRNCVVSGRNGGAIFTEEDGRVILDGYAIIPVENYRAMEGAMNLSKEPSYPCKLCGAVGPTADGHDPCIAQLPGVVAACCGHGHGPGYAMFENGAILRGAFEDIALPAAATKEPEHG